MTDAPEAPLWRELKTILRLAAQIFGEPAALLEDLVLPRRDARLLRAWLSALEAIARALLAAMALRLPKPTPSHHRTRRHDDAPQVITPSTEAATLAAPPDSERWAGVAFRIAPRTGESRPGGRRGAWRYLFVRSLAYRFEALIRVAEAPGPYARRLARRLSFEPELLAGILRRPPREPGRPSLYDDLIDEAFAAAGAAVGPPAPDSG
jgi:hypothetical protein